MLNFNQVAYERFYYEFYFIYYESLESKPLLQLTLANAGSVDYILPLRLYLPTPLESVFFLNLNQFLHRRIVYIYTFHSNSYSVLQRYTCWKSCKQCTNCLHQVPPFASPSLQQLCVGRPTIVPSFHCDNEFKQDHHLNTRILYLLHLSLQQ
jgi:hypothetical protein